MLKKTFLSLVLIFMSLSVAQAAIITYNGTGNYTRTADGSGLSTISQGSLITPGSMMDFVNSDTGNDLGQGGFADFDIAVGSDFNFWFTDILSGDLILLSGQINNILFNRDILGVFDIFAVRSSGDIFSISGTSNYDMHGALIDNSISVSGQYEVTSVPEPGSFVLMLLGIAGITGMRKFRIQKQEDSGYAMATAA